MNMIRYTLKFSLCLFALTIFSVARGSENPAGSITWRQCLNQRTEFYATGRAIRIADNLLLHQRDSGGWQKKWARARNALGR